MQEIYIYVIIAIIFFILIIEILIAIVLCIRYKDSKICKVGDIHC